MRYMGGKARIAPIVNACRNGRPFWEPFAGGLNMTPHLAAAGWGYVTDVHPGLAALYEYALTNDLPRVVTREEWYAAKARASMSALDTFIEFGCSFAGQGFSSGYAKDAAGSNYAERSARVIERDARASAHCTFGCIDFLAETPRPTDLVLYLDPPYKGTRKYARTFDYDRFEELACGWSEYTDVFISEYSFPLGEVVWEGRKAVGIKSGFNANVNAESHATERLYRL